MGQEFERGSGEETEGISPSSCLYWERDESGVEGWGWREGGRDLSVQCSSETWGPNAAQTFKRCLFMHY